MKGQLQVSYSPGMHVCQSFLSVSILNRIPDACVIFISFPDFQQILLHV